MQHPYKTLSDRHFWRSSVSETNVLEWTGLYKKRFDISPATPVASAGSCFAQHIRRQLVARGFNYRDYEKPPASLPESLHAKFGYGLFSARYGNVYTSRQLLQLFRRAFGTWEPAVKVWEKDGRFFDPYRPSVEPGGFGSADECLAVQEFHLKAVRRMFSEVKVFVFTMGLTEFWEEASDGAAFPACPGTVAGEFDSARHRFRNLTYPEVMDDMTTFISEFAAVNPRAKIILTVSPVALAATASPNHVVPATMYSKSVLRAAAQDLYSTYDFIDYFPSYDLISTPASRGVFFEPNLREVAGTSVDWVMGHFFREHAAPAAANATEDSASTEALSSVVENDAFDVVCEEEQLELARG